MAPPQSTSRRGRAALGTLLLLTACGGGLPGDGPDLAIAVAAPDAAVSSGVAFGLSITRTWHQDLLPQVWRDDALAPLVVRLVGVEQHAGPQHRQEIRHFRAWSFTPGETTLPAVSFRARPRSGVGPERSVASDPIRLRVIPALPEGAEASPVELPGGLLEAPAGRSWWWTALLVVAAAGVAAIGWRRRVPPAVAPAPAPATLGEQDVLRRLAELGDQAPRSRAEFERWVLAAADAVRDYLESHLGVPARERTTSELERALGGWAQPALGRFLGWCDLVKFAQWQPDAGERERSLALAAEFVRAAARRSREPAS